jgi:membrane protein implicated in regulation of membrane protease activity
MVLNSTSRRRWFGSLALLLAVVMLIAGETVLKTRLSALAFLAYWLFCLALTGVAVLTALADLRAVNRRVQREERKLLDDTVNGIETDVHLTKDLRQRDFQD